MAISFSKFMEEFRVHFAVTLVFQRCDSVIAPAVQVTDSRSDKSVFPRHECFVSFVKQNVLHFQNKRVIIWRSA